MRELAARIDACNMQALEGDLDAQGWARVEAFFSAEECQEIAKLYDDTSLFRKRIVMQRHGYGSGEYQYFDYPLPPVVETLRRELYSRLVPLANKWRASLNEPNDYPSTHQDFVERCHAAGQTRPTPLMLSYKSGDYNRLHQDLYGDHVFPLQVVCLLNSPGKDFEGGEFVLTEQRVRMQSRPMVVPLQLGDLLVFGVRSRPVAGANRMVRATLRHGVSEVRSGTRLTLGVIFHDAP